MSWFPKLHNEGSTYVLPVLIIRNYMGKGSTHLTQNSKIQGKMVDDFTCKLKTKTKDEGR